MVKLLQSRLPIAIRRASVIVTVVLMGACAGAPVQEMSDARQAVSAAEQAHAEGAAPADMSSARHYLQEAQAALDQGEYASARQYALRASEEAVKALRISQGQESTPPPP